MAVVSSCCEGVLLSQATSEICTHNCSADSLLGPRHFMGTALETGRKVQATVGLYAPNLLGYTRATMVKDNGMQLRKEKLIL
jgi:hypothetical protein